MGEKKWIPSVPRNRIMEIAEQIKPVVRFVGAPDDFHQSMEGEPYYVEPVDLFNVAYTWDPKPLDKAMGLETVCDIRTYHTFGYYGFFKPSIAEVLAQIPEEHLSRVIAFEIVDSPKDASDLNRELEAVNAGYHVAITRLYSRA